MNKLPSSSQGAVGKLASTVQHNCHIADSLYARDYSLCVYLLKMREFYRWERGLPFSAALPKEDLGRWLTEREAFWEQLEGETYKPISFEKGAWGVMEESTINDEIASELLHYGAGIGLYGSASFFLAELAERRQEGEVSIIVTGHELARDLTAYPAMSRGQTVTIRRESLSRLLWERIEEWRWRKQEGAMARAIASYPFDDTFDTALEKMTDNELESAILHELGEIEVGRRLGSAWETMLMEGGNRRRELLARAVRDHLADTLVTLPHLVERRDPAPLHFWFANLNGIRKALVPDLISAYRAWVNGEGLSKLERQLERDRGKWFDITSTMLSGSPAEADDPAWVELEGRLLQGG